MLNNWFPPAAYHSHNAKQDMDMLIHFQINIFLLHTQLALRCKSCQNLKLPSH